MKKMYGFLAAFVAASALFAPAAFASKENNTVAVRNVGDQKTYDPYRTTDLSDWQTHYQIFDSLFRETPEGEYVPALCTDYKISDDGMEMTFTIREGVKFHNGDVMTADDVVFSLNTAIASPFTSKFTSVMKEATKVDDKTVKLTLKHPYAPIIGCLVSSSTSIVPKKVYEADPAAFGRNKPVGTGPYVYVSSCPGESITMDAFPEYWRGEAKVKHHVVRIIKDNMSALMAMQSGTLDRMVPNQDYSDRQIIMDDPRLRYYEAPQACTFLVAFNNARGPFADKRVREAVARAIDKEELILGAVNGMADPTDGGIVPMCPQAPKDFKGLAYDPEMSKKLLADAGYANGLNVTMRVIGATHYTKPAEVLQAQLKKVGINMKIEAMERGRWFDLVLNKAQFDITFYAHAISVNDADFCTYPFLHSSQLNGKGTNYMGVNIPEMDECLDKARSALDAETRNANYARVCEIIRDESIYVPCYTGKRTCAAVAGLKGVFADPMQRYYVYNYEW